MCNPEVSKFMYKYTNSQLPATFNNYFKLITDVHPYNTRQPKNTFKLRCENVKVQCNRNPVKNSLRNKNKLCFTLFTAECNRNVLLGY